MELVWHGTCINKIKREKTKMSAKFDKSQGFQFYYGNAMNDLGGFLPKEEENSSASDKLELKLDVIESLVDQSLTHLANLQNSKRQLKFLLADLKRMVG